MKRFGIVLCALALAVPAAVSAKQPNGHKGQGPKTNHVNSHCKNLPVVDFRIAGTLDPSSTANGVVVNVTRSNKAAKPLISNNQYSVASGAKLAFAGANPFTTQGADFTKYRVHVTGKVVKLKRGCTIQNSSPAPKVRHVKVIAPDVGQK
jgi:hypothetical protein